MKKLLFLILCAALGYADLPTDVVIQQRDTAGSFVSRTVTGSLFPAGALGFDGAGTLVGITLPYQPTDADLTALAALTGTNTLYYRSAANTWTAVTIGGNLSFLGGTLNTALTPASSSTLINTTAPLTGGGSLASDRTLAITQFAGAAPGSVPTSLGGIANFLRADGTWAQPPGALGGTGGHASFTFNTALTEPVTGNQLRVNNANQTLATRLWVAETSTDGLDVSVGMAKIQAGHQIYFQDRDDASKWVKYNVTADGVDDGAYWDFAVAYHSGPANVPAQTIEFQAIAPATTGVPPGGTTGQALTKTSNADYAVGWATISGGGGGGGDALVGVSNAWADNVRQTFNPGAANAGFNFGSQAGDPSGPLNGDGWYDSTASTLDFRIGGSTVSLSPGLTMHTDVLSNAFQGPGTGNLTVSGPGNHGWGLGVLTALTSGDFNTALGVTSCRFVADGKYNTMFGGHTMLQNVSGDYNCGFGVNSLKDALSDFNSGYGNSSLVSVTTGIGNSGLGHQVLANVTTGSYNSGLGFRAGENLVGGSNCIAIGNYIYFPSTSADGQLSIGNLIFGTSLGQGAAISTGNVGIANNAPGELMALGTTGSRKGVLSLAGSTSGKIIIQPLAAAGAWTLTLPPDDGDAGEQLQTDGLGNLTWEAAGSGGAMATDPLWAAAGDLAVGTGNDTGAILTKGTALQQLRVNAGGTALEWAAPVGDVIGPASATDNAVVRFDATTGKLVQTSGFLIGDQDPPPPVGTTPGTSAPAYISTIPATGGNTTIATTGTGGAGASVAFTTGQGGVATAAATAATGGTGGAFSINTGAGGSVLVGGTGTNTGGAGGGLYVALGAGGAAYGASSGTSTGGTGGNYNIQAGTGGAATSGSGTMIGGPGGQAAIIGGTGGIGTTSSGAGGPAIVNGGTAAAAPGGAGGYTWIQGAAGSSTGSGGAGGPSTLTGGAAGGDNTVSRLGGSVALTAGLSKGDSAGGAINLTSGAGGLGTAATGAVGGAVNITPGAGGIGSSTGGVGGATTIRGGLGGDATTDGAGGAILFQTADTLTHTTRMTITNAGVVSTPGAETHAGAAMGALVIDVTKANNTKTIATDSTFTLSATPAADTWFGLRLTFTADSVITWPAGTWKAAAMGGATVTTTAWKNGDVADLQIKYNGSQYWIYGGPELILPAKAGTSVLTVGGQTALNTTDKLVGVHNGTKEVAIPLVYSKEFSFDPKAVCDGAVDRLFLFKVGAWAPKGITITGWRASFEADPTTELDLDLKRATAFIGVGSAALMDVVDTTAGVSSETLAGNINGGAVVANGQVVYLEFGTAYTETTHQVIFELEYELEED